MGNAGSSLLVQVDKAQLERRRWQQPSFRSFLPHLVGILHHSHECYLALELLVEGEVGLMAAEEGVAEIRVLAAAHHLRHLVKLCAILVEGPKEPPDLLLRPLQRRVHFALELEGGGKVSEPRGGENHAKVQTSKRSTAGARGLAAPKIFLELLRA
jgi:hypothetical protein